MRKIIDRWTLLTLAGAGAFMFWAAGHYTVFDDEAFSCRRYVMPAGEMVSALWHGVEPDPPLYYLLENGWVHLFGVGPLGLRSLSILLFLGGLVMLRLAGEAWFDRTTGRVAMLIAALHPAHLFFGFAGRWYSLMFLLVAVLLWITPRLGLAGRRPHGWVAGWAVTAAAVCYTNYFGPVIVGLAWLVGCLRSGSIGVSPVVSCGTGVPPVVGVIGRLRPWILAGLATLVLYAVWLPPCWRQAASFPAADPTWAAFASSAARTVLALTTGNLASVGAWWVWVPMAAFGLGVVFLLLRQWHAVWPMAVVTLGCFAAGVASRTMIDKYVMTFSGAACLLVAALLVRGDSRLRIADWGLKKRQNAKTPKHQNGEKAKTQKLKNSRSAGDRSALSTQHSVLSPQSSVLNRSVAVVTAACLVVGWIGCGFNLITERHWSSLRWLDPFERVLRELADGEDSPPRADWVMTHPSARYYYGCIFASRSDRGPDLVAQASRLCEVEGRIDPAAWRILADLPAEGQGPGEVMAATPTSIIGRMKEAPVPALATIRTAGFVELPDWTALEAVLHRSYTMVEERRYLEDRAAAWKDRLDPNVKHPRWRIVVRRWELRR